jgi:2-C-methyl-D-erythritol 4-phosphate cytidylyltransferase
MVMADLSVIIPAAGSGSRVGGEVPKPFLELDGISILEITLRRFDRPEVREIIVAVGEEWFDVAHESIHVDSFQVNVLFVKGGAERMLSIRNALNVVSDQSTFVAIHDAVRPFFTDQLFVRLANEVRLHGAVIPGIPVTDTIKRVNSSKEVTETPDRSTLFAVQTPQFFRKDWITDAYRLAGEHNYLGTDDASLCEKAGYTVRLIDGERVNFKITWPEDLEKASEYLKRDKNS